MINVWHDCDPGHDDAIALMYILNNKQINLVGISTIHGNQESYKTYINALRVLYICGNIGKTKEIKVIPGDSKPIKRPSQICPEIHGETGLGGVDWKGIDQKLIEYGLNLDAGKTSNSEQVADCIHEAFIKYKKLTLLVTGCHTNIAKYVNKYIDDINTGNVDIVLMGGSIDKYGNTGPWQEFNIQTDPEAFDIVLNKFKNVSKEKGKPLITIIPLDVTHTVLSTNEVIDRLNTENKFENVVKDMLLFFKDSYKSVFHFDYPPVHDPVAAFYLTNPEDFVVEKRKVVVETEGKYTSGALCIKRYNGLQKWCKDEEFTDCNICMKVNVEKFWDNILKHIKEISKISPL